MHTRWIGSDTMNTDMMISTDWSVQVTKTLQMWNFVLLFSLKASATNVLIQNPHTPWDGDVLIVLFFFPVLRKLRLDAVLSLATPSAVCNVCSAVGEEGQVARKAVFPWFRQAAELVALRSKVNGKANWMAAAGVKSREELEAGKFQWISNQ